MKRNLWKLTGLLLLVCLLLTACTPKGETETGENAPTVTAASEQQLTFAMLYPDTYCPLFTKVESNAEMLSMIYEGLFKVTPEYQAEPLLAESYDISEAGLVWTIHLKKGVLWHDGSRFTADDVVFTLDLIGDEQYESPYRNVLAGISSYKAVGEDTVRLELYYPDIFLGSKLTFPIVSKSRLQGKSGLDTLLDEVPVGTGAFQFIDTGSDRRVALIPYTDWWGEAKTSFNAIQVMVVRDEETRYQMMNIDKISAMTTDASDYERYIGNDAYKAIQYQSQNFTFVAIQSEKELLNDANFRRALSVSVDKEKLMQDLLFGHGMVADLPLSPEWYLFDGTEAKNTYDAAEAKRLLVASGYFGTEEAPIENHSPLKLLVNEENEERKALAEFLVGQWRLVDVNVEIESLPWEEYLTAITEGDYDLALMSTKADCGGDLQRYFKTEGIQNIFHYSDFETDRLFNEVNVSKSQEELRRNTTALYERLLKESPMIGLYFERRQLLVKQELQGTFAPTVEQPYDGIWNWYFSEK